MGCDIHTIVQVKINNKWKTVAEDVCDNRWYELFGILAGVRGGAEPITEPKGFPEDLGYRELDGSKYIAGKWMGEFGFSWYTLEELNAYYKIYEPDDFDCLVGLIHELSVISLEEKVGSDCVRFVFGFDN